mmetsp:Transcript_21604/g.34685  ORF Transcript_21604/g.34685 Transcript_21604/m.34685 type:complete len:211 (+) Transcript_21604:56-688(+)
MAAPRAVPNPHKLIWLQIMSTVDNKAYSLCSAEDLSSFGYFQRSTVREHLVFATRTSSERCPKGSRITISLKEVPYLLHIYRRVDGLCGIAITDQAYSERVAQTLVTKLAAGFEKQFGNQWKKTNADQAYNYAPMQGLLQEYANPNQADKMSAVQQNLEQIQQIMHKNIEDILARGETLDNLLEKSSDIGEVSKMFHKKAKKNNQCCQLY